LNIEQYKTNFVHTELLSFKMQTAFDKTTYYRLLFKMHHYYTMLLIPL